MPCKVDWRMIHAVYPGSFDPLHNGHLDIIRRASNVYDRLTVAVLHNPLKDTRLFSVAERLRLVQVVTQDLANVDAERFEGLLVEYMRQCKARIIVKGLRAVSDFDNEVQMAQLNRQLNPDVETTFLMADARWTHLSSTRVKEIAGFGADVSGFVPAATLEALKGKFMSRN